MISPDNSYEIYVDYKVVNHGSLLNDFSPPVNPPAEIDDPKDKKPSEWDEREKIPDPEATKPDDWDENAPRQLPDTSASKPEGQILIIFAIGDGVPSPVGMELKVTQYI